MRTLLLSIIAILLLPPGAYAGCYEHCGGICANPGDLDRNTCTLRCTNACVQDADGSYRFTALAPAAATPSYAAIALSPTSMVYGYATGIPGEAEAAAVAMLHCRENPAKPQDCQLLLQTAQNCVALALKAKETGGGFWGTAWSANAEEATKKARASCKAMAGGECELAYGNCTNIP